MTFFLYGIYHLDVCVYVGVSVDPKQRLSQHRNRRTGKLRDLHPLRLEVFREVTAENAGALEAEKIQFFWNRGEATRNKNLTRNQIITSCEYTPLFCVETGERFSSMADAARRLGVSDGTISNALRLHGGRVGLCNVTLAPAAETAPYVPPTAAEQRAADARWEQQRRDREAEQRREARMRLQKAS